MIYCGTGHRPNKLGGYSDEVFNNLVEVAHMFLCAGQPAEKVISGGALGWDQALARAAIDLGIPTVLALPFRGYESKWPQESKDKLDILASKSKEVIFVCDDGYAPWKMQKRNEWMVDHADRVLALWDGSSGGTANCIAYANKVGKPITNLWWAWELV